MGEIGIELAPILQSFVTQYTGYVTEIAPIALGAVALVAGTFKVVDLIKRGIYTIG